MTSQCRVNKISKICKDYCRRTIQAQEAMTQIQKIIDLSDEEMPPCTCDSQEENEVNTCSMQKTKGTPINITISMMGKKESLIEEGSSCSKDDLCGDKCGLCHQPGPMTINPFFNFLREMRENACFNQTVTEVAKEASRQWRAMNDCDKSKYVKQAHEVSLQNDAAKKRAYSDTSKSEPAAKVRKTM